MLIDISPETGKALMDMLMYNVPISGYEEEELMTSLKSELEIYELLENKK